MRLFRFDPIDVIFLPKSWQFKLYPRGAMLAIGGRYDKDGRIMVVKWRIGPPIRKAAQS
jgi:hypothetical protein